VHFDQLIDAASEGKVALPEDWAQGRATFGGLLGALAHESMVATLADDRPLRSLSLAFVGPAAPGSAVSLKAEILRQGKSVTQVESRLEQNGETVLAALGSYGHGRESSIAVTEDPAPSLPAPEDCQAMPQIEGMTPAFVQHIDMRFGLGGLPFTGTDSRKMGGWMRFREPPATITAAHLIALVDAWPPALLPMLSKPAPASSLSWTMELIQPAPKVAPDDWLLYEAVIDHARDGYGQTQARIWTRSGELVALSRQTVTVFA